MNLLTAVQGGLVAPETWSGDFVQLPRPTIDWVWPGYVARGAVTLLTSQWKAGKTTLISVLLSRLAHGGELAGLPVTPARAAVASEERLQNWQLRSKKLDFGPGVCFFCRPFAGRPTPAAWEALVDRIAELGSQRDVGVVVIDPLAAFLPGNSENNTRAMLEMLQPLTRLTGQGQAVIVLHHPSKGSPAAGQLARGAGALCASVDILVEMSLLTSALETDRRRLLAGWSRFDETPRQRILELSADGTDYQVLDGLVQEDPFQRNWPLVERMLAFPPRRLSRQELLLEWRGKAAAPSPPTLWRVLDRAVSEGLLLCEGRGTRDEPFRYWLAMLPPEWDSQDDAYKHCLSLVEDLLSNPPQTLTRAQLLRRWPRGGPATNPVELSQHLARAVTENRLQQQGTGKPSNPVRYHLPGQNPIWHPDIEDMLAALSQ